MESFAPFAFIFPFLFFGAVYIYLKINDSLREELTSAQIGFLYDAARGNTDAEKLVESHVCDKLSPREYAKLRCKVDVIVSSTKKSQEKHPQN